jgi:hypothetical protein
VNAVVVVETIFEGELRLVSKLGKLFPLDVLEASPGQLIGAFERRGDLVDVGEIS